VSGAGDVNGDGYSDVIIGAIGYDNGQLDEGVVFIYYGSSNGVSNDKTKLEIDKVFANFGNSVAGAGDINGDGYSDVIVGAVNFYFDSFVNGNPVRTYNGKAFLFCGSEIGLKTTPMSTFEVLDNQ